MKADIIACYPKNIIGKLISFISKCEISHVAIMIDDEHIIESDWFGVRVRKLKNFKSKYLILRCEELTEIQKDKIIKFVTNSINTEYDYKLLIGLGLKKFFNINIKLFNQTDKYICTELIIETFKSVGIRLSNSLYPESILKSNKLKIVRW